MVDLAGQPIRSLVSNWLAHDPALRPVSISTGSISTSDGSAVVKQGDTIVVCGIKLEISEPKTEKPKSGWCEF